MKTLNINLKYTSYKIVIENGLLDKLSLYIKEVYSNKKIFIILSVVFILIICFVVFQIIFF